MRERPRPQPMAYGGPSVERMLGGLPVLARYCRRLDLAGIIDRACPIREEVAILTHGQVIEALVTNRLTSPAPMVRVTDWARAWAVEEVFGIEAAALNDDRIARALDAIAPEVRMTGLYPGRKAKPTGRLVFQALAGLRLIPASGSHPAIIPQPGPVQAPLLDLLAVDPTLPP